MPEFTVEYSVTDQHPCYADHFPGHAIVPGALLLEWIYQCLQQRYPDIQITGIPSFKFLQPVMPGHQLQLHFQLSDDLNVARIECLSVSKEKTEIVAKGKLSLVLRKTGVRI